MAPKPEVLVGKDFLGSASFCDGGIGVSCRSGALHEFSGDGAAVMGSVAMVSAAFGDRGLRVALRTGCCDVAAGDGAAVVALGHCVFLSFDPARC